MATLKTELKTLKGIGENYTKKLNKLGIKIIKDLLMHFPHRYDDYSRVTKIVDLKYGEMVSVHGIVSDIKMRRSFYRHQFITEVKIEDDTGEIKITWFNQPYLTNTFKKGTKISIAGKVTAVKNKLNFISPDYELWSNTLVHTSRLVPVYPETRGLSSKWLRWRIHSFLYLAKNITDYLPEDLKKKYSFLPICEALQNIHFPDNLKQASIARDRFVFGEFLLLQLKVLLEREAIKSKKSFALPFDKELAQKLVKSFPFKLNNDQKKAAWEILKDMQKSYPMHRLLEGDVGTGKTAIAILVSALVAKQEKQAVIMAPTEILASQHFETFLETLKDFELPIALLTRSLIKFYDPWVEEVRILKEAELKKKIESGEARIIIGTHSLIATSAKKTPSVKFNSLALVIIDEQHRFGVEQRAKLLNEYVEAPHLLSMTATPIPRSLALTVYSNLDISILKEFPTGKRNIKSFVVPAKKRSDSYEFIREKLKQGNQAYVICPIIQESEKIDAKAAEEEYKKLKNDIFKEFGVALLHGRLKSKEKEEIMRDFLKRKYKILVATSVVEVGVDVANANIMIIEGAERFGMAQVHQLRGRIGRRGKQGYCMLFTNSGSRTTIARLKALAKLDNGFALAQKDLEIRGPGQLIGIRQSGIPDIAMNSLGNLELIKQVRAEAERILKEAKNLKKYPNLLSELNEFTEKVHLE
ncbi:MAG: ATP-dependent DNA helicase RecG [Parcubacteria group bacterium GW2011_GWA2_31_28]|nr:MAG: ATP-dependent DNA helicase RecG [Parcubacteria group bacterium GW2011_GWA2_31_28]